MREFKMTVLLYPMTDDEAQAFVRTLADLVLTYIRSSKTNGEVEVERGT